MGAGIPVPVRVLTFALARSWCTRREQIMANLAAPADNECAAWVVLAVSCMPVSCRGRRGAGEGQRRGVFLRWQA